MNPEKQYPLGVKVLFPTIQKQLNVLERNDFISRFNQRDCNLWSKDPQQQDEINHRMAWLDVSETSRPLIEQGEGLLADLLKDGYTHAVVLGMGGSSLAPEVYSQFARTFKLNNPRSLSLSILDSTSPEQIIEKKNELPLAKTLFIVSSKSGTTVEVNSLFTYFWQEVEKIDPQNVSRHFIAIGDPGTKIQKLAAEKHFRKVIEADPNVGGRFSALIAFGLIPAILAGFEGGKLLKASLKYVKHVDQKGTPSFTMDDAGIQLGVILGAAALEGKDKLTLLSDPETVSLGSWIEQLVAESSGKNGHGILPIDQEPLLPKGKYGSDRMFVYLRQNGSLDGFVRELIDADHPVYICDIEDAYDLAAEYFRWEIAVVVACVVIGVNAFNQPNVQESKDIAKQMVNAIKNHEDLSAGEPLWKDQSKALYGKGGSNASLAHLLNEFIGQGKAGDFIAINAFVARNEGNGRKLEEFRKFLGDRTGLPTTLGFGPRFLHSTGQLHKGGKNNGLFLVISQEEQDQLNIPNDGIAFNDLILAQALGDTQALERHDRRVIRLHFSDGRFSSVDLKSLF